MSALRWGKLTALGAHGLVESCAGDVDARARVVVLTAAGARAIHHRLAELTAAAFIEPNPIPAKAALAMMGRMSNVLRLPLVPLAEKFEPTVRAALVSVGAVTA